MAEAEWFAEWFDSPYYPILYAHRNEEEAATCVRTLLATLKLPTPGHILDLGCGDGRHAIEIARAGYWVTGVDLSRQSIERAKERPRPLPDNPSFLVRDMRQWEASHPFDAVFNLFTSFGYFDSEETNRKVLQNIYKSLYPGGKLVIDFLNAPKVAAELVPREQQTHQGINFRLRREIRNGNVLKDIFITDGDKNLHYQERVQLLTLEDFQRLFGATGFRLLNTFGSYDGTAYIPESSPRLILLAEKLQD